MDVSKIGVPQNGWFPMENLLKMDDFGVPLFFGNTHMFLNTVTQMLHGTGRFTEISLECGHVSPFM